MKASKKTIAALMATASLLLTQCAPKVAKTVEAPSKNATVTTTTASQTELQEGQKIFETNCGRCHALKQPEEYTTAQWEKIIPSMAKKARLDEHQTALVHAFIMKGAKT